MIENNEFATEYAGQLVSYLTVEQRRSVFAHIETLFDEDAIDCMKSDVQQIIKMRADMDRRLAAMDAKTAV